MSGQSPSPSSSNQRSLDSDSGGTNPFPGQQTPQQLSLSQQQLQLISGQQHSLQHLTQRSLQSSSLWSGACGPSLSPVTAGSSGHTALNVSLNVSLALPSLPLTQLGPPSPDELSPVHPQGPPSPGSVAHMPLTLGHHGGSLLPYVDDLDFLGSGASSPSGAGLGPLGAVSEENSVDSFLSSHGVSRLPPVSSIIKKESSPPSAPSTLQQSADHSSQQQQQQLHSHSQSSLELTQHVFSNRSISQLLPSHSSEPQHDWQYQSDASLSLLPKIQGSSLSPLPVFLKQEHIGLKSDLDPSEYGSLDFSHTQAQGSILPSTTSHSLIGHPGPSHSTGAGNQQQQQQQHQQQQQQAQHQASSSHHATARHSKRKALGSSHHQQQQQQAGSSQGALAASSATTATVGGGSKQHICPVCSKVLATRNVYQLHMRSHSGEKPFKCEQCGNKFSQKTSLTRHFRSHTGERPFPCEVCGKRFADKERIKIHMRTHTGEKPFSCEVCGKRFSQKSTVKRHMSVHTGAKPFQCTTCGKGFANRGNLNAHAKTHGQSSSHLPSSSVT